MKLHGTMCINERGNLEIGGCDTIDLVKRYGSPLYVVDEKLFRDTCRQYYQAFVEKHDGKVLYASKAFLTTAICKIIDQEGLGLDVVSGGEIFTAKAAGFPMERAYFHGNNKTEAELMMAIDAKVGRIVVDNFYEMELLNRIAAENKVVAQVLLRITPGVEAHTHEYIKTGQIDSKFGFTLPNGQALEAVKKVLTYENLSFLGLHCHIGSQIFELKSYQHAASIMMEFVKQIFDETAKKVEELNLGGGFGIYYTDADEPANIAEYADLVVGTVREKANHLGLTIPMVIVEPGRSIAGPAGSTLYTVGSVKEIPGIRKYVAIDGGMTDNIRPALYKAKYEAMLANRALDKERELVSITGKCCESGDMLIWDIQLPPVKAGDILAVACTGAYGYSMANNYNRLLKPGAVLVYKGESSLILQRETYTDLIRNDVIPERLTGDKLTAVSK
ncbi:MAG: diaminopimelate decarboxylase [Bacillota bacterium]|nr:diaminopimelate decarboxylase [Bacillota bacterium]